MLNALRLRRNRPCLHAVLLVLLASWVSTLVSSTCTMPVPWRASGAMRAGCTESAEHGHHGNPERPSPAKDCSFQPCLDSTPNPASGSRLDAPEPPLLVPGILIWPGPFHPHQAPPRVTSPPEGRHIALIYRFCTLLN